MEYLFGTDFQWRELGLVGLFIVALLAATILPLGSELLLAAILLSGTNPIIAVVVATAGNVLGSCVNYALGYWLSQGRIQKWLRISEEDFQKAEGLFNRYGLISLLFAWLPIIGDPITFVAGVMRASVGWFLVLVTLGKCLRYIFITYVTLVGTDLAANALQT